MELKRPRGRPKTNAEPTQGYALRLPVDLHQWLGEHAREQRFSVNRVIVDALADLRNRIESSAPKSSGTKAAKR